MPLVCGPVMSAGRTIRQVLASIIRHNSDLLLLLWLLGWLPGSGCGGVGDTGRQVLAAAVVAVGCVVLGWMLVLLRLTIWMFTMR